MSSYELYIPPVIKPRNGRFQKGRVPENKGKKWDDYMPKSSQRRCRKGWKNLQKYRPTTRPDTAGRCRKPVVAVTDEGRFYVFDYVGGAAKHLGCSRENIGRCCRENRDHRPDVRNGHINTDHRYMGIRWYFEDDEIWMEKINNKLYR